MGDERCSKRLGVSVGYVDRHSIWADDNIGVRRSRICFGTTLHAIFAHESRIVWMMILL